MRRARHGGGGLFQRLGLLGADMPLEASKQILDDLKRLFHAHILLGMEYAIRPYPGRIVLFRPDEVPVAIQTAEDRGWGQLTEGVEVFYVPGHHHSMVKEPQVQVLAEQLRRCLARVEGIRPGMNAGPTVRKPGEPG